MVAWLATGLEILREGVSTNWWGLQCLLHCQSTSVGAILAGFFFGCLVGSLATAALGFYIYIVLVAPIPAAPAEPEVPQATLRRRQERLRGYLHA